jgi:putative hydrolase of the HAD superfamily
MPRYKHYSFDLWLTLIKSNPAFKTERAKYFHQHFNFKRKAVEEVATVFRQVDVMCNNINECTGGNIDAEEMYLMVISQMNDYDVALKDIDIHALYDTMEQLLMNYMPVAYCGQTAGILSTIRQEKAASVSLLSNTGFIKGCTLRKVLNSLELEPYFDYQIYSDEEGMSKPNKMLYQRMLDRALVHHNHDIELSHIIHIGDNVHADFEGARAVGIQSLLINSNELTIQSLLHS